MSGRFIVLLAGKSGSGKSTVAEILAKKYGMRCASSYTTRKPRFEGEPGHIFVTDEEFDRIDPGEMVAYTEFAGYRYCATIDQINDADLYIIDKTGINEFFERYDGPKDVLVVYLDASEKALIERMRERGDSEGKIKERIAHDRVAFEGLECDLEIETDRFPAAVVAELIIAELTVKEEENKICQH